jgi:hypothetical protein
MTSPHQTDPKRPIDSVDALRVLVTDLRALAEQLALKERSHSLQKTLKTAQERVSGPRSVVMLLSEHEDLKRRFLERLLGPNLAHVPNPTVVCTRLEYGLEPECTISMPQGVTAVLPLDQLEAFRDRHMPEKTTQIIRLPNPALKDDLAVIDTPVVKSDQPAASVLACADQSDAWIFVLHPDHELSEASEALLRQLPEHGTRLEMVVEGAETLTAEVRLAARERLMQTLRERCDIETPRLTLVASAPTEGDEESFWHGRFATFHSVMMRRGRERWMDATRAIVMNALSEVAAEINVELKSVGRGQRHARLRLGMKELDGLRTRFDALALFGGQRASETTQHARTPDAKAADTRLQGIQPAATNLSSEEPSAPELPPLITPPTEESMAAAPVETSATFFAQPAAVAEPAFATFRRPSMNVQSERGLSINFSEKVSRLIQHSKASEDGKLALPKRIAGVALALAFVCFILWALAPRVSLFGHEAPSEWEYEAAAKQSVASPVAATPAAASSVSLPQPDTGSLPDTAPTERPAIPSTPLTKRGGAIRTPLVRPIPSNSAAGAARSAKRHHRHLLGLAKLWHWMRHGNSKHAPNSQ